jgi:ATP-binding cassette, subfamily B, bacterial
MGLYASVAAARVSLRRVHEILDTPAEVEEAEHPVALESARGEVSFEGVTFDYDRGVRVLDGVSLTVMPGESVAVVGPSGAGKSTIADLLVRQLDPHGGRIRLDGHDLRTLRLSDLRRHVVTVDQEPFIFNTSIADNIRYARPDAKDEEVLAAAHAAGLADLVARLPHGVDTGVGERGRELSAGERQRVAIARAFLADPAVLILDEATGSLDPATEAHIVASYESLMRGRATIVITHRPDLARRANRTLVLNEGRLAESGIPTLETVA